jgi:hypothetical protein
VDARRQPWSRSRLDTDQDVIGAVVGEHRRENSQGNEEEDDRNPDYG